VNGHVIMYGDKMTDAMKGAIDETERRRSIQMAHNEKHGITPKTIVKKVSDIQQTSHKPKKKYQKSDVPKEELPRLIEELTHKMDIASQNLEFEKAAELRDQIDELEAGLK
jgi:excinuclease ABC subunit B